MKIWKFCFTALKKASCVQQANVFYSADNNLIIYFWPH